MTTPSSNISALETQNLFGSIDRDNVFGLNISVPEHAREVIKPWDQRESLEKLVESAVDDQVRVSCLSKQTNINHLDARPSALHTFQLIIHVPFTQNVRIRSILLRLGEF
jgi:hypothetical protein